MSNKRCTYLNLIQPYYENCSSVHIIVLFLKQTKRFTVLLIRTPVLVIHQLLLKKFITNMYSIASGCRKVSLKGRVKM